MIASTANERGSYYPLCLSEYSDSSSSGVIVGDLDACFTMSHLIQTREIEHNQLFPSHPQFFLLRHLKHLTCLFCCHLLDLAAQEMSSLSLCLSFSLTPGDEGVPRDVQLILINCQHNFWLCWKWQKKGGKLGVLHNV